MVEIIRVDSKIYIIAEMAGGLKSGTLKRQFSQSFNVSCMGGRPVWAAALWSQFFQTKRNQVGIAHESDSSSQVRSECFRVASPGVVHVPTAKPEAGFIISEYSCFLYDPLRLSVVHYNVVKTNTPSGLKCLCDMHHIRPEEAFDKPKTSSVWYKAIRLGF